ncbi:hypothetical protein EQH57_0714 [Dictyocoela roeselum]|nr:hypothetical protein EQH57_0714 [Dictyocoela roeselum]
MTTSQTLKRRRTQTQKRTWKAPKPHTNWFSAKKKLSKKLPLQPSGDLSTTIETMEHSPGLNKRRATDAPLPTELPPLPQRPKAITFKIQLIRSKDDREILPRVITDGYVKAQLNRLDEFGLKLVMMEGDAAAAMRAIREGKVSLDNHPIAIIPHSDFVKCPRIPTTEPYIRTTHISQ